MASIMLSRLSANTRSLASATRFYATAPSTYQRRSVVRKAPATTSSAAPGRANPSTVDTIPNTADEVDVPSEAYAMPAESVPSSSALRPSAAPAPESVVPVPFADSSAIGGSSKDPSTPDWSRSYFGLSTAPFPKEAADILMAPIDPLDVEMKPDGLIYLPEIKYRRILNRAFGPGGWGLAPRGETNVSQKVVSREYALICLGRLVGIARGEQEFFDQNGIATATEAAKSNALMRCCKDLGIASELWDPRFIREFKAKHCIEVFVEDSRTKKKKKLWRRKDQPPFGYPYTET
ncbi:Mitochondrial genome maintenance protein MGM101 [Trametes pubescens]|uniref:Mitochondrial genome maintenance protein MGM101 n=1 Tax=Trametes pubescens TaxID=154538 RepID=A0A1M2VCZ4_TRAPU|nr:Mitochondrial genome maintenance protein MGM101 [Trametes pubescens]